MKSMNNDDNNDNSWLGFSLSPHMNIEVSSNSTHHQNHEQSPSATTLVEAVPTSLFHATTHLNSNYGSYNFGNESTNGSLYSPLSMMPLKSDGSLCIMEALNRSHSQAITSPTPKLEDFFGSATMGTHQYENNGSREVMALSLDSMFYQQNQNHEPSNQSFLNHLQQNSRPQHFQGQQNLYYTGFRNNDMLIEEQAKETQHAGCNFQLPTVVGDVSTWNKNLVSRSFSNTNAVEQKHSGCTVENGCEAYSNGAVIYGDIQSLNLSMSPGSQSSCVTMSQQILPTMTDCVALEVKKRGIEKSDQKQIVHRKSIDTFGQRTSQYRGVTRHRWTGRYEAHLWDNSYKKEGQSRKGRQVYLGGYDMEEKAARSYDLAALKYWGPSTHINFPLDNYQKELEEMKHMNRQEYVAHLRRRSSGFSRGASMYRGVTRHHQHGRWQARIGRVAGNKDLYLGTFSTQEEAAEAYDVAAIKFRGINAVTNFDISRYDVEKIMASNNLLSGELARRNKNIEPGIVTTNLDSSLDNNNAGSKAITQQNDNESNPDWKIAMYQSSQHPNDRTPGIDNYKSHTLKSSSDKRTEISAVSSVPQVAEKFTSIRTHLSNPESLVTSLSSSREGSPDRSSQAMPSEMHPSGPTFLNNATSTGNSWIPAAQLRPALRLPTVPVFSTWTDG